MGAIAVLRLAGGSPAGPPTARRSPARGRWTGRLAAGAPRRIALVILLLFAVACATARPGEPAAAMRDWLDALNSLDEGRVVDAFAEDATAFFPTASAERVDGRGAIAAVFREYFQGNTKKTNIVPEDLRVQQSGDIAVITFNVHNPSAVSRRTFVWRRGERGWRIVHLHASNTALKPAA